MQQGRHPERAWPRTDASGEERRELQDELPPRGCRRRRRHQAHRGWRGTGTTGAIPAASGARFGLKPRRPVALPFRPGAAAAGDLFRGRGDWGPQSLRKYARRGIGYSRRENIGEGLRCLLDSVFFTFLPKKILGVRYMFFWSCSNIGIGNPRSDRGCLCIWEAPQTQATTMEVHGPPSAGRPCPVDLAKTKVVVAMRREID